MFHEDPFEHLNARVLYSPFNIPGCKETEPMFNEYIHDSCVCEEECSTTCSCILKYGTKNYDEEKRFLKLGMNSPVFECNENCQCTPDTCLNRVVQLGPLPYLDIKETQSKGFGLFAQRDLKKGT